MSSGFEIVQRIEYDFEFLEPGDIEFRILDIVMVRLDLDVRVEFARGLFCDLISSNQQSPNR